MPIIKETISKMAFVSIKFFKKFLIFLQLLLILDQLTV